MTADKVEEEIRVCVATVTCKKAHLMCNLFKKAKLLSRKAALLTDWLLKILFGERFGA